MTPALALGLALALTPVAAGALTLSFPGPAASTVTHDVALGSYDLAVGPWQDGKIPTVATEGPLREAAWRIDKRGMSTLQLLADLRGQLEALGYKPLFQCDTDDCGGFDFRYGIFVLPEPQMHVDLGDFRYFAAERTGAAGKEYLSLTISRSTNAGFVQMVQVGGPPVAVTAPAAAPAEAPAPPPPASAPMTETGIAAALEAGGSVALDDLDFGTGSAQLTEGDYPSLTALAAYLLDHPDRKLTLVGHTDAEGGLDANIALSKRRAESVRARLVQKYGVNPSQVSADGVGYLAPRATNQTEAGRTKNRRVEAMLTSTN